MGPGPGPMGQGLGPWRAGEVCGTRVGGEGARHGPRPGPMGPGPGPMCFHINGSASHKGHRFHITGSG